MNYYIIPKNNFNIRIELLFEDKNIEPFISSSLFFYLKDNYNQYLKVKELANDDNNEITIDYIDRIINPFEFIHTNVPGTIISVSKVKPDSKIFFELMELFQLFNISEILSLKHKINIAHLTPNHSSTHYLLNMLREENDDNIICENFDYNNLYKLFIANTFENKLDLIICEFYESEYNNTNCYIKNMLLILLIITKYQSNQGTCIIKIDNLFYKPIIDIIFILSALYEKVYLIKPIISNIVKGERYLICKTFNSNMLEQTNIIKQLEEKVLMRNDDLFYNGRLHSIIENNIPYYFLNKLEESNSVIGQQQLEAYDQIINIFKNKNRDDKLESIKRNHIQKCIQWCEKNQLPHNKFIDKVNIFLNSKRKEIVEEKKKDCSEVY